jgi:hypothetical protein
MKFISVFITIICLRSNFTLPTEIKINTRNMSNRIGNNNFLTKRQELNFDTLSQVNASLSQTNYTNTGDYEIVNIARVFKGICYIKLYGNIYDLGPISGRQMM